MKRVDVPTDLLVNRTAGELLVLPDGVAHYVTNVMRRQPGDGLELFDGTGNQAVVEITSIDDDVTVEILQWREADKKESPLSTVLFQAIPKGKRWGWILEKATELGVRSIVPLHTERTVKRIPDDRVDDRLRRWDKKVSSAARQCGRALTPELSRPRTPGEAYEETPCDIHLVAHPGGDATGVVSALKKLDEIERLGIWIGPEGGFTQQEVDNLTSEKDVRPVHLGPRILRADTAGIAALAIAQAIHGDFV